MSKLHHLKQEINEIIDNPCEEEFADCFMLLIGAWMAGGGTPEQLLEAVMAKYQVNKIRKWGEPDENGVVKHI
jgi:hypothetical protein